MKPWLKELLIKGRIVPDTILRSFKYKEFKEEREQIVKIRYNKKKIKKENSNNVYPHDMKICIDLSRIKKENRDIGLTNVIFGIINNIDPENIYMFNVLGKESGYKYYLGEKVIIYQITNKSSIDEIKQIKNYLNETEVHGIKFEKRKVRKILITTVKYQIDKDWKKYTIKSEEIEYIIKELSKI